MAKAMDGLVLCSVAAEEGASYGASNGGGGVGGGIIGGGWREEEKAYDKSVSRAGPEPRYDTKRHLEAFGGIRIHSEAYGSPRGDSATFGGSEEPEEPPTSPPVVGAPPGPRRAQEGPGLCYMCGSLPPSSYSSSSSSSTPCAAAESRMGGEEVSLNTFPCSTPPSSTPVVSLPIHNSGVATSVIGDHNPSVGYVCSHLVWIVYTIPMLLEGAW